MTQAIIATREGQGIARGAVGKFTGDGTIVNVTLGFKPKTVRLINLTDAVTFEKIDGMLDTQTVKTTGVPAVTVDTGSAIVLTANGFSVSATAGVSAKSFVFYAG